MPHFPMQTCSVQLYYAQLLSHVQLFAIPRSVARQALLSMVFLQARILEWFAMPSSKGLPNPGINPGLPCCRQILLPFGPPGKPKNTGVGSLSLLQGNFLTQELNRGLLHCRWILQQLSYPGSPYSTAAAAAKSLQSCPTLCDPIDCNPPGSPIPGILQARTLEWVAISSPMCKSEVAQSCPTLHHPMDCSLPGSSIHGIFQARVLEWVATAFSV